MIVWGLAFANESRSKAGGALLAASILIKPIGLPAIFYSLLRGRAPFVISLLFFVIMLAWLPSVFVGTGYAFHETTEYITSLTTRVPHLSHDLYNKYNQSAAAIAVRLFTTKDGRGLCGQGVAAIAGFVFQLILSICRSRLDIAPRCERTRHPAVAGSAVLHDGCVFAGFLAGILHGAGGAIHGADVHRLVGCRGDPCQRKDRAARAGRRSDLECQHSAVRAALVLRRRVLWLSGRIGGDCGSDQDEAFITGKGARPARLRRWSYLTLGRLTNTAAATTEVHSPSRSPIADCVTLRVVTILSETFQMSLRSS